MGKRLKKARLTKAQWGKVRARWESDPRVGYVWLIKEMELDVDGKAIGSRRRSEGWKKTVKASNGRPSQYMPEYAEKAKRLCLLGATDQDMANFFGVNLKTIANWKNEHSDFLHALREGKEEADANVARSLYERACGYSHPSEEIKVLNNEIERVETVKHYPPDTAAAIIWLKNRQPHKWRDKVDVEQKTEVSFAPIEHLEKIYSEGIKLMTENHEKYINRKTEELVGRK